MYTGSKAQNTIGLILAIGPVAGTGSPTFTPIFDIMSTSISGRKWDQESTTNFASGSNKEYLKTLLDSGKLTLAGNRVSSDPGQVALKAAFLDPVNAYIFQIQYPKAIGQTSSGDTETFNALVTDYDQTLEVGKVIKLSCSLQITGVPVDAEGS